MAEIVKSKGTTQSERYLSQLAERTFLNLWAFPNVYRDTMVNGRRAGKELCDILVVCGDNVIIFSDKKIEWQSGKDVNIAWGRWYRNAIKDSVRQLRRAEKWINQYPERIFLDQACKQPLPVKIPFREQRKVYLVSVALGAHEACSNYFSGDSGSFMICPSMKDDSHHDASDRDYLPFTIGDVNSSGTFVHVMNDITLDIIMKELDTVTDFTDYLRRKEMFIRSGNLLNATGEEELLAYYLTHMVNEERHDFAHPKNRAWMTNERIAFDQGFYASMLQNPQYIRKKEADRNSYLWDNLIEAFTKPMLAGTTIVPDGNKFEISNHEIGVRYMALEPRLMRRMLGNGIIGVLKLSHLQNRYFRSMLPPLKDAGPGTGYAFMTLALPRNQLQGGYEQYRRVRANMLAVYCMGILRKFPHVKRVVGIATEPLPVSGQPSGSSEDMVLVEQPEWTPKLDADLTRDLEAYDIMKEDRVKFSNHDVVEYPEAGLSS